MPEAVSLSGFTDVGERTGSESESVTRVTGDAVPVALAASILPSFSSEARFLSPLDPLKEFLTTMNDSGLLFCNRLAAAAETAGSANRLSWRR